MSGLFTNTNTCERWVSNMSEQYEWIMWQLLSDSMRLFLLTLWGFGIYLAIRSARRFWQGFREWERVHYGDR